MSKNSLSLVEPSIYYDIMGFTAQTNSAKMCPSITFQNAILFTTFVYSAKQMPLFLML